VVLFLILIVYLPSFSVCRKRNLSTISLLRMITSIISILPRSELKYTVDNYNYTISSQCRSL
jgi:hypothetical protein